MNSSYICGLAAEIPHLVPIWVWCLVAYSLGATALVTSKTAEDKLFWEGFLMLTQGVPKHKVVLFKRVVRSIVFIAWPIFVCILLIDWIREKRDSRE